MKFVILEKRSLVYTAVLTMLLVGFIAGVYITNSAVVWSNVSNRSLPIHSVDTSDNKVALSFDASWGATRTEAILEVLEINSVPATFFVTGEWMERHSERATRLVESELIELGTLSNTHPHMTRLSNRQMELELSTGSTIIKNATGKAPTLFRAPYGEFSDSLLNVASSQNLTTIQWSVDALDWQDISSYDIASRVMAQITRGSIIRMQNDGRNTVNALSAIIVAIQNKGFTITNVGDLIYTENYTIDQAGKQTRNQGNTNQ
ncbi:MAG: polysaccharide deacetylase family protein [Firmicutes bacterium]|nr:polysaccharide deacetylase family protein [Bacillota bacterium]